MTLSSRTLPQVAARLGAAGSELGLPDAAAFSYPERTRLTRVLTLLHQAGQPGRGFRERRALRREAQADWAALLSARSAAGAPAEPRLPSGYAALAQGWDECERQLTALRALAPLAGLEDAPEAATAALAADRETPWKLPDCANWPPLSACAGSPRCSTRWAMSRWQRTRWRPRSTMPGTGRSWTRRIYGGALTTFPGVAQDDCLRAAKAQRITTLDLSGQLPSLTPVSCRASRTARPL